MILILRKRARTRAKAGPSASCVSICHLHFLVFVIWNRTAKPRDAFCSSEILESSSQQVGNLDLRKVCRKVGMHDLLACGLWLRKLDEPFMHLMASASVSWPIHFDRR